MTVADVVKVTHYLTRAEDIPAYGKVRTRFLGGRASGRNASRHSSARSARISGRGRNRRGQGLGRVMTPLWRLLNNQNSHLKEK